jgi:hypothetical protein
MITFDDEMKKWFRLFSEQFHDVVPLAQISGLVTNEQLIDAIKQSIEAKEDLLPVIFGYGGKPGVKY